MNAWESRYTNPGAVLQLEKAKPPSIYTPPGKQYCEQGKHYVPRVPYVTRKGWMCDECLKALRDAA